MEGGPTPQIRLATPSDAPQMLAIYAPCVIETAITFEVEPPSEEEFRSRIAATLQQTPWLACEAGDAVIGYAYAGQHRERAAYQWSVDCSIYVHADHRGRGVGRALYASLFACLKAQGYYNVYAGITLPNPASIALHEGMGFTLVGVYQDVGFKLGLWHDVGWWRLALRQHGGPPSPPRPFRELVGQAQWWDALSQGQSVLER